MSGAPEERNPDFPALARALGPPYTLQSTQFHRAHTLTPPAGTPPDVISALPSQPAPRSLHVVARYPSLERAVVFITGGASGIGRHMVRAFAAQGARVGFVDIAAKEGRALAEELTARARRSSSRRATCAKSTRCRAAFAKLKGALGPAGRARQQRRARRPPRLARGDAGILGRADRDQPAPHVFRDPGRRARHDRGRQGLDHQFRLEFVVASLRRHARLHHRQGGGAWHDALVRARPRQASHPRQHDRAGLGDDGTAEDAVGQPDASSAIWCANACPT